MPPGPKPKPLEVTKRKRRVHRKKSELEPVAPGGRPTAAKGELEPPADLDPKAVELWREVVPALDEIGVLVRMDLALLKALVTQYAYHEESRVALDNLELDVEGIRGSLEEDGATLGALRKSVDSRVLAQAEAIDAMRSTLGESLAAGDRGEVLKTLVSLAEKLEEPPVKATELAAIAKLELNLATLGEYLRLREQGVKVALGSTGQLVEHPLVDSTRKSAALMLRIGEQYALTPSGRARLAVGVNTAKTLKTELDRELGGGTR